MTSEIQKWCRVGYYIDAKDNMNEWCMAEVKEITKTTVKVTINDWAPKWETVFPIKSSKIAPFRKFSRPHIPVKLRGYKSQDFSLPALVSIHDIVKSALQTSLLLEDAFHTTQFYRGKLFLYTDNLFSSRPPNEFNPNVINFTLDLLKMIQKWLGSCKSLFPYFYQGQSSPDLYLEDNNVALANGWFEIVEIFKKLLGIESRLGDLFNYIELPYEFSRNLGICSAENRSKWTKFFLETFVSSGFEVILDIVQNEDEKSRVPFVFLNHFPVYEILELLAAAKFQNFATSFNRAVLKRIEIVSELELKVLKHEEIIALLNRLKKFRVMEGHLNTEQLKLIFFLKMLKSAYLEKRVKGLIEINSAIESLENKWAYEPLKLKQGSDEIKNCLYHEDIFKIIFTDRPHVELVKRANVVLKFFAKNNFLDKNEILMLWDSLKNKHESYVRATYEVIIDLSSCLTEEQNDFLFLQFCNVSKDQYDLSFLTLVKEFTVKAITTAKKSIFINQSPKRYGVHLFQDLLKSNLSEELNTLAIKSLVGIISENICHKIKTESLKLAKFLIKRPEFTKQGIRLFLKIMKQNTKSISDTNDLLLMRKILNLGQLVIENLKFHLQKIPKTENLLKFVDCKKNILYHLNFLCHIAERSHEGMPHKILEDLWTMFTDRSSPERAIFFYWLNQLNRFGQSQQISYIFRSLFLNDEKFSPNCSFYEEFLSFSFYFLEYNRHKTHLELVENRQIRFRKSKKIKGLEKLVNIFIHTDDERIMHRAGSLIYAAASRYDTRIISQANEIIDQLVELLMVLINENKENEKSTMRILMLFQVLLDKCDEDGEYNFNLYIKKPNTRDYSLLRINQYKTIRHIRKEIAKAFDYQLETVAFTWSDKKFTVSEDDNEISKFRISYIEVVLLSNQQITEFPPFDAISENQGFINLLFDLVSDTTKSYTDLAWTLLLTLPTCKRLKLSLVQLKSPLRELIDVNSTYKLLYALKIVLKKSKFKLWVERFRATEGVGFMIAVFIGQNKELSIKLRAMKELVIVPILGNVIDEVSEANEMVKALFRSFKTVAKAAAGGEKLDQEQEYFKSLKKLIKRVSSSNPEAFQEFLLNNSIAKHIKYSLIFSCSSMLIECSCLIFLKISKLPNCLEPLYSQCFNLLNFALGKANKSSEYWDLLSALVKESSNLSQTSQIAPLLLEQLQTYPAEPSSSQKDEILCGVLKLINTAIEKSPIQTTSSHFSLLLHKCLCEIPEHSNQSQVPKCKHPDTRLNGFLLILQLCYQDVNLLSQLTYTLDCFHQDPSWRTSKRSAWIHSPVTKEKSYTGFVGLKNLGCTCYMNSILQQLFMIPSFMQAILGVECKTEHDNLLYQLQFVFAGLRASDKQYINPKNFAKAFKDPEGNEINVVEQMDVDEFFASFLDKLETLLKGTDFEDLIKIHFGGVQVTELIGKECPHRSERQEPFLSISVEVKNKKTLLEGLESYVAEELLEGENSYQCDHCENKVKAIRRVCVKSLPNFLILALRRFEFDFDTMNREKLNDFFEFPFELNMEPYTQEGLEKGESKVKDYYLYTLRGIVIHSGTAEIGHYYSYICHEGRWLEFNDTWIGMVNPLNIPNECFGGEEKLHYSLYSKMNTREKLGNAYMLIYERKKMFRRSENSEDGLEVVSLSAKEGAVREILEIKRQNKKYWISKITFGQEYINFIVSLCKFEELDSKFVVRFFLTILIRSKEKKGELFEVFARIEKDLKNSKKLADWFLDLISVQQICRELLLYNPLFYMRKFIVGLCKIALNQVDQPTHEAFFTNLLQNLKFAKKKHSRHFSQYLELLKHSALHFSSSQSDIINTLTSFVLNRPFSVPPPFPHQFEDIYLGYNDYKEEHFPEESLHTDQHGTSLCHIYHLLYIKRALLSEASKMVLKHPVSFNMLINDTDNKAAAKSVGRLLSFLSANDRSTSFDMLSTLIEDLKAGDVMYKSKIFAILTYFFEQADGIYELKAKFLLESLNTQISQCKSLAEIRAFIKFLKIPNRTVPKFHEVLMQYAEIFNTLESVIMNQISVNRQHSILTDDPLNPHIKTLLCKVEALKQQPLFLQASDDENFLGFAAGGIVKLKEGYPSIQGVIKARADSILLIEYPNSNRDYQELRDLSTEDIQLLEQCSLICNINK